MGMSAGCMQLQLRFSPEVVGYAYIHTTLLHCEHVRKYVQAESGKAMQQVLGATASARQETVTPPPAAAGQRDWEQVDCGDDGFDERGDISPE